MTRKTKQSKRAVRGNASGGSSIAHGASSRLAARWGPSVFGALWCLLVVWQGGFSAPLPLTVGIVGAILVAPGARFLDSRILAIAALVIATGVACCLSAIVNGEPLSSVTVGCVWISASSVVLIPSTWGSEGLQRFLALLGRLGVAGAALGVLMYAQVIPWPGGVTAGRLQFFFQYANGAGILFAALYLLSAASDDRFIRNGSPLLVMALGLTASVGAALCFLTGLVVLSVACRREGDSAWMLRASAEVLLGGCAALGSLAIASAAAFPAGPLTSCVLAAAAVGARIALEGALDKRAVKFAQQLGARVALAALAVGIVVLALVFGLPRLIQATETFTERLFQIGDALTLWTVSPLLGMGPDAWQHLYQQVQTIDYETTLVHGSFAQLVLDGGLLSLVPFCIACCLGLRALVQTKQWAILSACIALLLHATFDFDFRFGALLLLILILLGCGVADVKRTS